MLPSTTEFSLLTSEDLTANVTFKLILANGDKIYYMFCTSKQIFSRIKCINLCHHHSKRDISFRMKIKFSRGSTRQTNRLKIGHRT